MSLLRKKMSKKQILVSVCLLALLIEVIRLFQAGGKAIADTTSSSTSLEIQNQQQQPEIKAVATTAAAAAVQLEQLLEGEKRITGRREEEEEEAEEEDEGEEETGEEEEEEDQDQQSTAESQEEKEETMEVSEAEAESEAEPTTEGEAEAETKEVESGGGEASEEPANEPTNENEQGGEKKVEEEEEEKEEQLEEEKEEESPPPVSASSATSSSLSLEEKMKKFYQYHYDSLDLKHTKGGDVLSWITKATGGPSGPGFLDGILIPIDHYRIELGGDMKFIGKNHKEIIATKVQQFNSTILETSATLKQGTVFSGGSPMARAMEIPTHGIWPAKHVLHFQYKSFLCKAAKFFEAYHSHPVYNQTKWPHIAFVGMHRDFGALSQYMPGQTYTSNHRQEQWKLQGCSLDYIIKNYLDHPDTIAVITTQYHIIDHPKVHSIPLGMKGKDSVMTALNYLSQKGGRIPPRSIAKPIKPPLHKRPTLVMINFKPWPQLPLDHTRHTLMEHLASKKFLQFPNGTSRIDLILNNLTNTYVKAKSQYHTDNYYASLMNSKFILSPSGWGIDCYRHWEALYTGTIPVIETTNNRADGWFRVFDHLPVALIDDYRNLTPQWLEAKYDEIVSQWNTYQWNRLKRQYWIDWVKNMIPPNTTATGIIDTTTTTE